MGIAVIVRDEELGLAVVAIHDLGDGVLVLHEARSDRPSPSTQKRRLLSRSALGMTGMQDSRSIYTSPDDGVSLRRRAIAQNAPAPAVPSTDENATPRRKPSTP